MAAVFKSILVAAALLLVGFGVAGAVWSFDFNGPCRFAGRPATPIARWPRAAYPNHVWVSPGVVQAPTFVNSWRLPSQFAVLQVARAALESKLANDLNTSTASETDAPSSEPKTRLPRFCLLPNLNGFRSNAAHRSARGSRAVSYNHIAPKPRINGKQNHPSMGN